MKSSIILLAASFLILAGLAFSSSTCRKAYSHCNVGKPDHINVHIVAHTHNDLGWIKTVDQYFNGSSYFSVEPTVKNILDNVVQELKVNPKRRFVYVEMGFFWMWWNIQNTEIKALVRSLVNEGRLEFLMGSW